MSISIAKLARVAVLCSALATAAPAHADGVSVVGLTSQPEAPSLDRFHPPSPCTETCEVPLTVPSP